MAKKRKRVDELMSGIGGRPVGVQVGRKPQPRTVGMGIGPQSSTGNIGRMPGRSNTPSTDRQKMLAARNQALAQKKAGDASNQAQALKMRNQALQNLRDQQAKKVGNLQGDRKNVTVTKGKIGKGKLETLLGQQGAYVSQSGPRKGQAYDVVHRNGQRMHRYVDKQGNKRYVVDKQAPDTTARRLYGKPIRRESQRKRQRKVGTAY